MKYLNTYNKFILEQTVNPNPPAVAELKPTGVDLEGNKLTSAPPPSGHKVLSETKGDTPGQDLMYHSFVSNSKDDEYQKKVSELQGKGWKLVWEETKTEEETVQVKNTLQPKQVNLDFSDDKFFGLGEFVLSEEFYCELSDKLGADLIYFKPTSILIHSSTDKTRVLDELKETLKKGGYTTDNAGLTKARAESARNTLVERMGIDPKVITYKLSVEQGGVKSEKDRFVKLTIQLTPREEFIPKQVQKGQIISYFQKIVNKKIYRVSKGQTLNYNADSDECPWFNRVFGVDWLKRLGKRLGIGQGKWRKRRRGLVGKRR